MIKFCLKAVSYFQQGKRFELVRYALFCDGCGLTFISCVYNTIMNYWEGERRYEDLARACGDMQQCYLKIIDLNK